MKTYIAIVISLLLTVPQKTIAQSVYQPFIHYVSRQLNPPKSVREACEWQYAVVKIQPDKQNRVVSYRILNKTADGLKKSFEFLKGYQFPAGMHLNSRPLVFCVSITNERAACATQRLYTPSQVLGLVYADLRTQLTVQPNTIFVFDMVDVVYSTDAIRN